MRCAVAGLGVFSLEVTARLFCHSPVGSAATTTVTTAALWCDRPAAERTVRPARIVAVAAAARRAGWGRGWLLIFRAATAPQWLSVAAARRTLDVRKWLLIFRATTAPKWLSAAAARRARDVRKVSHAEAARDHLRDIVVSNRGAGDSCVAHVIDVDRLVCCCEDSFVADRLTSLRNGHGFEPRWRRSVGRRR